MGIVSVWNVVLRISTESNLKKEKHLAIKHSSAEKRHRQSEERRIRNKSAKSAIKTSVKKFTVSIQNKDAGAAEANLKETIKKLDTAAGKGILHKNTAARKKSRIQKLFNMLKMAQ